MESDEYEKRAKLTYDAETRKQGIAYLFLGLGGESGEALDKYKKVLRNKNGVLSANDCEELAKELGDVLWYLTMLANQFGYTLGDVMQINLEKLEDRKKRGVIRSSGDNR